MNCGKVNVTFEFGRSLHTLVRSSLRRANTKICLPQDSVWCDGRGSAFFWFRGTDKNLTIYLYLDLASYMSMGVISLHCTSADSHPRNYFATLRQHEAGRLQGAPSERHDSHMTTAGAVDTLKSQLYFMQPELGKASSHACQLLTVCGHFNPRVLRFALRTASNIDSTTKLTLFVSMAQITWL